VLALCEEIVLIINILTSCGAQQLDLHLGNFLVLLKHGQPSVKMVDLAFVTFFFPEDIARGTFCEETESNFLTRIATHFGASKEFEAALMSLSSGRLHSFLYEPKKSLQWRLLNFNA